MKSDKRVNRVFVLLLPRFIAAHPRRPREDLKKGHCYVFDVKNLGKFAGNRQRRLSNRKHGAPAGRSPVSLELLSKEGRRSNSTRKRNRIRTVIYILALESPALYRNQTSFAYSCPTLKLDSTPYYPNLNQNDSILVV
jgi:hypothetical protein